MKRSLLRRKFVLFVLFTVLNEESSIPLRKFSSRTAHSSHVYSTTSLLISLDDIRNDSLWLKKEIYIPRNQLYMFRSFSVILSELFNKEKI